MRSFIIAVVLWPLLASSTALAQSPGAVTALRFLYPGASGSWVVPWAAKEGGYFSTEGLDVEFVRVGGSTRIVAVMLSGNAPMINVGGTAAVGAIGSGSDAVIIAASYTGFFFHLMARPNVTQPADLIGKRAGMTTFGSTSDVLVRLALQKYGLDLKKDVTVVQLGGQAEGFAALHAGFVEVMPLTSPLYLQAKKAGMKELINFSELGVEDIGGAVVTTRAYLKQQRGVVVRFMRAFLRATTRYKSDKAFGKALIAKYGQVKDEEILEETWKESSSLMQNVPRPSLKAVQFAIDTTLRGKAALKPESFVDTSVLDELVRTGFVDSLSK